ncbi:2-methylcitrate dehydratase [Bacillus cereus]|uniref:2-methylcitrate dehydratase n=1 Tax=Bacillus cereus TaxID=1396 RepID=A0A9X6U8N9_BACCE|nr:2-methylcitrate dehydratase [Bacillus cereus]PEN90109.1 2-methylcitrate dehydratase [Bacillus cereus]
MAYIEFKPVLKKVNLKPDGKKEIVLEVTDSSLQGKLDSLSEMIDANVFVSLESMQVNFNVTMNAKTNEPVTQYEVDEKGIVQEVKATCEQIEADLNMPVEKVQTREEKEQADREVIDAFIVSGLAPNFEGIPNKIPDVVKRRLEGESYLKLASELNMSSGQIIETIDEYRKRVAPLAIKWHEWREQQPDIKEESKCEEKQEETVDTENEVASELPKPSEEFEITDEDKSFEEEQE